VLELFGAAVCAKAGVIATAESSASRPSGATFERDRRGPAGAETS
jgi:hypothetical protein